MLADNIQRQFPDGTTVPEELRALCRYAEKHDGEVSGCFEFDVDGRESSRAWFGGDEDASSRFAAFGRGPDGSVYAFWLHAGPDATRAPVVLLDSECEGSAVIAADVREFLRLLAAGYDEPGRYPTLEPDNPESASGLRRWLKTKYNLAPPANGAEVVDAARTRHPDLMAWVREWQRRHAGDA